jgi:hypothetical protein
VSTVSTANPATPAAPATPQQLLTAADRILSQPPDPADDEWLSGHWPRTCALLIRLALEAALDGYWQRVAPSAVYCSMRAQLLLLPQFASDADTVTLAREAWLGLSRAAHHHAYELAPTAGELRGWHSDVAEVTARLS